MKFGVLLLPSHTHFDNICGITSCRRHWPQIKRKTVVIISLVKFPHSPILLSKQICFSNGNVLFFSLFSLVKNWMHNVVWGCTEILPSPLVSWLWCAILSLPCTSGQRLNCVNQSLMEEWLMLIIEDYCQFIHENRSTRRFEEALLFTVDRGREIMPADGTDQIKKFVTVPLQLLAKTAAKCERDENSAISVSKRRKKTQRTT